MLWRGAEPRNKGWAGCSGKNGRESRGEKPRKGQEVEGCRQAALNEGQANHTQKPREPASYCLHTSGLRGAAAVRDGHSAGTAEVEAVGKMCSQGVPCPFLHSSEDSGFQRSLHQLREVSKEDHADVCPIIQEADPLEMQRP